MAHSIIHNHKDCIGCGACAAISPKFFEMTEQGKAHLKKSKKLNEKEDVLEISDKEVEAAKEAAESCPVSVIKVK